MRAVSTTAVGSGSTRSWRHSTGRTLTDPGAMTSSRAARRRDRAVPPSIQQARHTISNLHLHRGISLCHVLDTPHDLGHGGGIEGTVAESKGETVIAGAKGEAIRRIGRSISGCSGVGELSQPTHVVNSSGWRPKWMSDVLSKSDPHALLAPMDGLNDQPRRKAGRIDDGGERE